MKNSLQLNTASGVANGYLANTSGVYSFFGLAYAEAPIGEKRFEPPAKIKKANKENGHQFAARCYQRKPFRDTLFRSKTQSEDCLFLNIWTPTPGDTTSKMPVLVFLHGGAFLVGDGSEPRHDGKVLAAEGLVVVSVNFRQGILGFFSHPEMSHRNLGFWDINEALDWLKENIEMFGGDPQNITLAGSSTGAFAACVLATSRVSSDKISKLIMQSPAQLTEQLAGLFSPLKVRDRADIKGSHFACKLGCSSLDELKKLPVQKLFSAPGVERWNTPMVDGEFLPSSLQEMIRNSVFRPEACIVGMTSAERGFEMLPTDGLSSIFSRALIQDYHHHVDLLSSLYCSPKTEQEQLIAWQLLRGEKWIGIDILHFFHLLRSAKTSCYHYLFDKTRPSPISDSAGWTTDIGAGHSTEIEYFLSSFEEVRSYLWRKEDEYLSSKIRSYLKNFLYSGNPNSKNLPEWPEYASGKRIVLSDNIFQESMQQIERRVTVLAEKYQS